ncbi:hypothetical protein ABZW51_28360 [Streptomyces cellulosae]
MPDPFSVITADGALRATGGLVGQTLRGTLSRPKISLIKLGSRDERRDVYSNFFALSVAYRLHLAERITRLLDLQEKNPGASLQDIWRNVRIEFLAPLMQLETALDIAYAELLIVGRRPAVIAAGEYVKLLRYLRDAPNHSEHKRRNGIISEIAGIFIEICRRDLGYEPSWWQFWRRWGRLCASKWSAFRMRRGKPSTMDQLMKLAENAMELKPSAHRE